MTYEEFYNEVAYILVNIDYCKVVGDGRSKKVQAANDLRSLVEKVKYEGVERKNA